MVDSAGKRIPVVNCLIAMACLVIVIAGMREAQSLLSQLLLAAFLAVICFPPLAWLQRKGLPMGVALGLVIGGMGLALLVVVALVGSSVNDFYRQIPDYSHRLGERMEGVAVWLEDRGIEADQLFDQQGFDSRRLLTLATTLMGGIGSLSSNLFVILLVFVFILLEAAVLPAKLSAISSGREDAAAEYQAVLENLRRYLAIKTQVSMLTGVLVYAMLLVLRVDYAALWGLLAFLFNFVPNIGSILAAIPAVLLAFLQRDLATAAIAGAGYLALNTVIGNIIEPRLMGRGLGLSTLVVLLSLLFWGWVLGPVGMLLSVPLTMIVKIVLQGNDETRWIAVLLDSEAPRPKKPGAPAEG